MRWRNAICLGAVAAVLVTASGCNSGPAPYATRMAYLDKITNKGIEYRRQLQQQGTPVSEKACEIGWDLLKPGDIPYDEGFFTVTPEWTRQVEEAYVKGCMTGKPRPKPEPSGVHAVTPVPLGSESPVPTSSPSA